MPALVDNYQNWTNMPDIKPSEISSVLQMQLDGYKNQLEFEEIGKVLQVSDGVARVYGSHTVHRHRSSSQILGWDALTPSL